MAPAGWRVPSDADWQKLVDKLGGKEVAGEALKASRPCPVATDSSAMGTSTIRAATGSGGLPPRMEPSP
jgi:uncharacterized protein (TIGR02145 family)